MPNALLVTATNAFFQNRASVADNLKILLTAPDRSKGSDQAKVAELRAAVDMLHSYLISDNETSNQRRLERAEDLCSQLIQLPHSSPLLANLHGWSRFVLAAISFERNEPNVCAVNIAHAFARDPRWSRLMFREIFNTVFYPHCVDMHEKFAQDQAKVKAKNYRGSILTRRAGAIILGAGVPLALLAGGFRGGGGALTGVCRSSIELWQSANAERARAEEIATLEKYYANKIDQKCQSLALNFL